MNRLAYSRDGFLRRVEMGSPALFVIVEGQVLDPVFYDRLCRSSQVVRAAGYQVWVISQVNGGSGGKASVLQVFDYYRRLKRLSIENQRSYSGRSSVVFCVDRDLDHLTGGVRRSEHVLYTRAADVEAEIVSAGDDVEALEVAASLSHRHASAFVDWLGDWRADLATVLRGWIELCVVAAALSSHNAGIGLGHKSPVNGRTGYGTLDRPAFTRLLAKVRAKSRYDAAESHVREQKVMARLEAVHRREKSWELVRGKWIPGYLEFKLREFFADSPVDTKMFAHIIGKTYLATIRFDDRWWDDYRRKLERFCERATSSS